MLKRFICGGVLVLAGTVMATWAVLFILNDWEARHAQSEWPTVQGTVVASEVWCQKYPAEPCLDNWYLAVEYTYAVEGVAYSDKQEWSWVTPGGEQIAKDAELKYAPGTVATVHYDPTSPGNGVLQPGRIGDLVFIVGLAGLAGALMGVWGIEMLVRCFLPGKGNTQSAQMLEPRRRTPLAVRPSDIKRYLVTAGRIAIMLPTFAVGAAIPSAIALGIGGAAGEVITSGADGKVIINSTIIFAFIGATGLIIGAILGVKSAIDGSPKLSRDNP